MPPGTCAASVGCLPESLIPLQEPAMLKDPRFAGVRFFFFVLQQPMPGRTAELNPAPDFGEQSYRGHERLKDCVAIVTGGDSGIGRAVAIAFAREGADVVISYLNEHQDAEETARWVERAGRRGIIVPGDLRDEGHCIKLVERTVKERGRRGGRGGGAAFQ